VIALADGAARQPGAKAGFLAGFAIAGWSLVTGLLMPVVGSLFDAGAYRGAFWLAGLLPVAGVVVWRAVARQEKNWGGGARAGELV